MWLYVYIYICLYVACICALEFKTSSKRNEAYTIEMRMMLGTPKELCHFYVPICKIIATLMHSLWAYQQFHTNRQQTRTPTPHTYDHQQHPYQAQSVSFAECGINILFGLRHLEHVIVAVRCVFFFYFLLLFWFACGICYALL